MGVTNYDGSWNRISEEIGKTGKEIERVSDVIAKSEVRNETALLYSWDNRWALEQYRVHPDLDFRAYFLQWHREFEQRQIGTDIIAPEDDFSAYKAIVVPLVSLMSNETAGRLAEYVRAGGILLFGTRSGVKDVYNTVVPGLIPTALRPVLGIEIEEAFSLKSDKRVPLMTETGNTYKTSMWVDIIEPKGASVLARYDGEWYRGRAAITMNRFGKGAAYYFGTFPEAGFYETELTPILFEADIRSLLETSRNLRVLKKTTPDGEILFILNPGNQSELIEKEKLAGSRDLLTGKTIDADVTLEPFDIRVLRR